MRKAVDAKSISEFSLRQRSTEGKETANDDVKANTREAVEESERRRLCKSAPARGNGSGVRLPVQGIPSQPPAPPSREAGLSSKPYTCSVCNAGTARADMTARSHCKSCSKLCTQLRSRHGKLKYLQAAYQQLGTTAQHPAVLKLATRLAQDDEGAVAAPSSADVTGEALQHGTALQSRQQSHLQPLYRSEVTEVTPRTSQMMPVKVGASSVHPAAAKQRCARSTQWGNKPMSGNPAVGPKVKSEPSGRANHVRTGDDAGMQV